jgi:hypothetical protein
VSKRVEVDISSVKFSYFIILPFVVLYIGVEIFFPPL